MKIAFGVAAVLMAYVIIMLFFARGEASRQKLMGMRPSAWPVPLDR